MSEKNQRDSNDDSNSKRKTREEKESGSSTQSKMKHCAINKMASGSEDICPRSIEKKDEHPENKEVTFITLQKKKHEVKQAELWETCHKHIFMEAGKYDNKHGVGIMLNERWRKRTIDTECINERAITTTVLVNRQHIKLMSVYFPHSKNEDHHIETMYKTIEKHMLNNKKYIPIIGGDFNAELGPGKGTECKSVGKYTLNDSNKRGDWLKSWLMKNDYSALNTTMFRKTPHKQTSFVSPKGKENKLITV